MATAPPGLDDVMCPSNATSALNCSFNIPPMSPQCYGNFSAAGVRCIQGMHIDSVIRGSLHTSQISHLLLYPLKWKGTRIRTVYCHRFYTKFCAYYSMVPPQTIHFKQKLERSALILCAFKPSTLTFNVPEYRSLQAYINVKMTVSLIFETFLPMYFDMTGCRTIIVSHATTHNHVVLTNACANRVFTESFSPGLHFGCWSLDWVANVCHTFLYDLLLRSALIGYIFGKWLQDLFSYGNPW